MTVEQHSRRVRRLAWLGYATLLVWPLVAFVSLFSFDAPGSEDLIWLWGIVGLIWSAPIGVLLAPWLARKAMEHRWVKTAYAVAVAPAAVVVLPLLLAAAGLVLEVVAGGA
jgi:peptidoglycan/LPS O-acetylase OafA/YrhL